MAQHVDQSFSYRVKETFHRGKSSRSIALCNPAANVLVVCCETSSPMGMRI
jgi:hypothetical protein